MGQIRLQVYKGDKIIGKKYPYVQCFMLKILRKIMVLSKFFKENQSYVGQH